MTSHILPSLLNHADEARTRLMQFYSPFSDEMDVDGAICELRLQASDWQKRYCNVCTNASDKATAPLLRGLYPSIRHGNLFIPEPVTYLEIVMKKNKLSQLFISKENIAFILHCCEMHTRNPDWAMRHHREVAQAAFTHLIDPDVPAKKQGLSPTNDFQEFLRSWAHSFGFPDSLRRTTQMQLLDPPIYNTIRRLRTAERQYHTNVDRTLLEDLAVVYQNLLASAIRTEQREKIRQHPELTDFEKQVLDLRLFECKTNKQVSVVLESPTATVHDAFTRAVRRLAEATNRK